MLRRSTKGSPSGGEGEADSEAVGHVAVATWQGWSGGANEEERNGGEGGGMLWFKLFVDEDDEASLG